MAYDRLINTQLSKIPAEGQYYRDYYDKFKPKEPTIVITYGPPASGKGYLLKNVPDLVKFIDCNNCLKIIVDDMIEGNPDFDKEKDGCSRLLQKYPHCPITVAQEQEQEYKDMVKECSRIYMKYKKMGADNLSTALFAHGLKNRMNIIYETTGNNLDWFVQHDLHLIPFEYSMIFIYPLTHQDVLLKRSCERGKIIGRFPENEVIRKTIKNAETNFIRLLESYNPSLDSAIFKIYDNEANPPKLLVNIYPDQGDNLGIQGGKKVINILDSNRLNVLSPNLLAGLKKLPDWKYTGQFGGADDDFELNRIWS